MESIYHVMHFRQIPFYLQFQKKITIQWLAPESFGFQGLYSKTNLELL